MADELTFRVEGLERLMRKVRDPKLLGGPIRMMLERSAVATAGNVRERTPVDTGRLRASVTHSVDSGDIPRHAVVGTDVVYAKAVEAGSKPHFPPLEALQPWAVRHGFPPGTPGAFLVARAIAARGTKPREMFQKGLAASLAQIRGFVETAARGIEQMWERR